MPSELIIIDPQQLYYENDLLKLTVLGGIRLAGLDRLRVTLKVEVKGSPRCGCISLYKIELNVQIFL